MVIPIICFAIAAILLILLVVINVRASRQKQEMDVVESQVKQEQLDLGQEDPASETVIQKIAEEVTAEEGALEKERIEDEDNQSQKPVVEPVKSGELDQETKPFRIEDSSYREALKKFQAKKPELVKEKKQISDSDYRNALRSMQKKNEQ
ncbi:hypothetical protein [Shimazuella alba]|uniref:Uncharacterized protein n=1 Tax=Shimazuella alba TaxID=2690964 RepID=A0A6I4W1U1_9BACL|nr:hypothetical protein [Shimazuella alba]MXQ55916.1 hypothetical protein [Shimazuella alba]